MKKLISLLLAAAMCSSIALSGCGSSNDIQTAQSETEQSTEEETTEDGKNYPLHYTNRGLFS